MRNLIYYFSCIMVICSCKAEKIDPDKVISAMYVSNYRPNADGTTMVDVSVKLPEDADEDKRNIIFHTTGGTFLTSKDTVITQKAEYINDTLHAFVKLIVPNLPGIIDLTARPATANKYNNFVLKKSIEAIRVTATKISLSASAASVSNDFTGEIFITATLKNEGNVSQGNKVVFEDIQADGKPASGRYRLSKVSSDSNSTASTYYSAAYVTAGTDILIICTLLDDNGQKTSVSDTIKIAIINHN